MANFPAKAVVAPVCGRARGRPGAQRFIHRQIEDEEVGQHGRVTRQGYEVGAPN